MSALELAIPRTIARLGDVFDEYFDRFLAEQAPQTHYLRDVTQEFLDFCAPRWEKDLLVPPYMMDLARHEACRIEIAAMPTKPQGVEPGALQLDKGVRFIEALRLARYDYAVHELPDDEDELIEPAKRPVQLLVYRSPAHEVRYLETTPAAAEILENLLSGQSLEDSVMAAAKGQNLLPDDTVLHGTARLLTDLAERGALLGSA